MKDKIALVDLDGTLFDTNEINYYSYKEALEKEKFNNFNYNYFVKYCNGKSYTDFLPQFTNNADNEIIERIHNNKKKNYKKYLGKAKENIALVNLLNSIKSEYYLALVTTASYENTMEILNYFKLNNFFDLVITSKDCKLKKPNPEGFLRALKHFNITKEKAIVFEDSEVGIKAAKAAGIATFAVCK